MGTAVYGGTGVPPPLPVYKLRPCPSYSRRRDVYGQATVGVGTVMILYVI